MSRKLGLDVLPWLFGQLIGGFVPSGEHDEGRHELSAWLVRLADRGGFGDRRVREQRALHREGADPVARRDDDVVGAPEKKK